MAGANQYDKLKSQKDAENMSNGWSKSYGPWRCRKITSQSSKHEQTVDLQLRLGGVYAENQVEITPGVHSDACQGFVSASSSMSSSTAGASKKQHVPTNTAEDERQVNSSYSRLYSTLCSSGKRSVRPFEEESESSSKKAKTFKHVMIQDSQEELLLKMPSVSCTAGGIRHGQTTEGFLYNYGPEQVSIVCICHGRFFSPAEFVKHAGGAEIENPMKHIVLLG